MPCGVEIICTFINNYCKRECYVIDTKFYTTGQLICLFRKWARLSQRELAQKIGVADKTVCKWEKDLAKPSLANLRALEELFHTSLQEGYLDSKELEAQRQAVVLATGKKNAAQTFNEEIEYHRNRLRQLLAMEKEAAGQPV